jgi:NAD(P)H-dependent flavin oxidoreductase YrpB (nitropropane dioxygenase family)
MVEEALALEAQASTTHHDLLPWTGARRWMDAMESGAVDAAFPLGQCVGLIDDLPTCAELIERLMRESRGLIAGRLAAMLEAA